MPLPIFWRDADASGTVLASVGVGGGVGVDFCWWWWSKICFVGVGGGVGVDCCCWWWSKTCFSYESSLCIEVGVTLLLGQICFFWPVELFRCETIGWHGNVASVFFFRTGAREFWSGFV